MLLVSIPPLGIKKTMALSKLLSAFTSSRCISLIAAESIIAMILTLFFASISLRELYLRKLGQHYNSTLPRVCRHVQEFAMPPKLGFCSGLV